MIFCEFNYCIYNKRSECILNIISISPQGICEDCLIPQIDDETLDKYKKEALKRLEPQIIKRKPLSASCESARRDAHFISGDKKRKERRVMFASLL